MSKVLFFNQRLWVKLVTFIIRADWNTKIYAWTNIKVECDVFKCNFFPLSDAGHPAGADVWFFKLKCYVSTLAFKPQPERADCSASSVMMDVRTSQINAGRCVELQEDKHGSSRVRIRVRLSQVYSAWESRLTDGGLASGLGSCHRGKILLQRWPPLESTLDGSVFWESWPRRTSPASSKTRLQLHNTFEQRETNTWQRRRGVSPRLRSRNYWNKSFSLRSQQLSNYLRTRRTAACFLKEQKSRRYLL